MEKSQTKTGWTLVKKKTISYPQPLIDNLKYEIITIKRNGQTKSYKL